MPTKPSTLPRWAETAGGTPAANITAPASGQKDTGWTLNQIPPSSYFNWWMQLVYKWVEWLDDLTNQALTWVSDQVFESNVEVQGSLNALGDANVTGDLTLTGNAFLQGNAELTGVLSAPASARVDIGAGANLSGAAPSSSTAIANALTKKNIAKAWVNVSITTGGIITVNDGFNVTSVTQPGGANTNTLRITFAQAFSNANFAWVAHEDDAVQLLWFKGTTKSTAVLDVAAYSTAGASQGLGSGGGIAASVNVVIWGAN